MTFVTGTDQCLACLPSLQRFLAMTSGKFCFDCRSSKKPGVSVMRLVGGPPSQQALNVRLSVQRCVVAAVRNITRFAFLVGGWLGKSQVMFSHFISKLDMTGNICPTACYVRSFILVSTKFRLPSERNKLCRHCEAALLGVYTIR